MTTNTLTKKSSTSSQSGEGLAFLLDIDGVILHGHDILPTARSAFERIRSNNVPYIFLTNSTGDNTKKSEILSRELKVQIRPNEVLMAQSPVNEYFEPGGSLVDKQVLIISSNNQNGPDTFAQLIGCKNYYTVNDLHEIFPYLDWMDRKNWDQKLPQKTREFKKIEAVLLLGEPVAWERSLQLVLDVILGQGDPNQRPASYPLIDGGNQIPIIAANVDLAWHAKAAMPRFGNGAFLLCLEALYKKFTGEDLIYERIFGKPSHYSYEYCRKRLMELYPNQKIEKIICVGDNPKSDIAGANNIRGRDTVFDWESVLVRTGIYKDPVPDHSESSDSAFSEASEEDDLAILKPQSNRTSTTSTCSSMRSEPPEHAHRDFIGVPIEADIITDDILTCVERYGLLEI